MTAISKYPDEPHVVVEPSSTTSTTPLYNGNGNNNGIIVDDTSKRKRRYCGSDGDLEDAESDEANCSGYDDLQRISSPVPTFPNIPWSLSREYFANIPGLHNELLECYFWLMPTEAERFARCNVCQRVRNVLIDVTPDAIFYVFGSVATNLFLPTSDIDISVELPRLSPYVMQDAAAAFRNSKNFKDVNVLDRAHVPIIKLTDRETSINIDISFNTSKAHAAVDYIMYMRAWFPALELFTLILKQFLASRQLNQAFTGGLSSYGLVLMIVHYMLRFYRNDFILKHVLQLHPTVIGQFFMGFLDYYGNEFDPLTDALAFPRPDDAELMSKEELTSLMNENLYASILCVQDPLTPSNDVGRGSHNFMQVKAAFSSAFKVLDERIKNNRLSKSGEPMLQSIMSFSPSFVQFRRTINGLPFENILEHSGNVPFTFGGQQAQISYDNEPRDATLIDPPPVNPLFSQLQQHHQRLYLPTILPQQPQPNTSTFDESNGIISIEHLSASSSEASSATPTAFSSPRAIPAESSEYYSNYSAPQMPPTPQQIFFPSIPLHQPRHDMFSYNPYFAFQHHLPQPMNPWHHQYMNEYINPEYPNYSETDIYFNNDQQQQVFEDDFDKILTLGDEEEDLKRNNGNTSDASDSSGHSSESVISTVTPECYDDLIPSTTEDSSNVSLSSRESNKS